MVHKNLFSFPHRPLPSLFQINIMFALVVLPIATALFLYLAQRLTTKLRILLIVLLGIVLMIVEQVSEKLGWFVHSDQWRHEYSFLGCILFGWIVWKFYCWHSMRNNIK